METDPDSPTAVLCRNQKYCHAFHEFGNNEVRYQVEPNVSRRIERSMKQSFSTAFLVTIALCSH